MPTGSDRDRHVIGGLAATLFGIAFSILAVLYVYVVTLAYNQDDLCNELKKLSQRQGVPLQIECPPHRFLMSPGG